MNPEEWRDVVGYEGVYKISSLGSVFSIPRWRAHGGVVKWLYGRTDPYPYVTLHAKYIGKPNKFTVAVHILVAAAFIGPRPDGMQVNHRDGNKSNPSIGNLEYVTPRENMNHAVHVIRAIKTGSGVRLHPETWARGERSGRSKLTEQQVLEIRAKYIPRKYHQGILSREYGVSATTINTIVCRMLWTHI